MGIGSGQSQGLHENSIVNAKTVRESVILNSFISLVFYST